MKFIKITSKYKGIYNHINPEWITHINESSIPAPGSFTAVFIHGEDGSMLVTETPEQILKINVQLGDKL